jgi:DNA processing protein
MSSPRSDLKYWLGLSLFQKFGPTRFAKMRHYFPSLKEAFLADSHDLIKAGIEEQIALEFITKRQEIDLDQEMEKLARENIQLVTINDEDYPALLKEIYQAPPLLYYKGTLKAESDHFAVSVVGTRKISSYGQQVTPEIVRELVGSGVTIVSGLAVGVDALAHETTIEAGGRTIAVLGSGLDSQNIYPSANRYLSQKIIEGGGLLLSEYPCGTLPLKHHFPYRNRLISGLSLGTLVIEAPENSGALLTARYALDQNREVFAVPGNIYAENSSGPLNLIKMGARPVTTAQDILDTLHLNLARDFVQTRKIVPDSQEEAQILAHLSSQPVHIDELIRLTRLDSAEVNSTLTLMEMKGRVRNLGGMMYVIGK